MKIITIILMTLCVNGLCNNCPIIFGRHGDIVIMNNEAEIECNITVFGMNNVNIKTNKTVNGMYIGIVAYECGNCIGEFISKYECMDCIICLKNEMVKSCSSTTLWTIVIIASSIIVVIITSLTIHYTVPILTKIYRFLLSRNNNRKVNKNNKRDQRVMMKLIRLDIWNKEGVSQNVRTLNEELDLINEDFRINNSASQAQQHFDSDVLNAEYHTIKDDIDHLGYNITDSNNFHLSLYSSVDFAMKVIKYCTFILNKKNVNHAANFIICNYILSSMVIPIESCSLTLWQSSQGKYCIDNDCTELNMYQYNVKLNDMICIKLLNQETLIIELFDAQIVTYYNPVYYTSLFKQSVKSNFECKKGYTPVCNNDKNSVATPSQENNVYGYGCDIETMGCNTCFYSTVMVRYLYELVPIGKRYPVVNRISEFWTIKARMTILNGQNNKIVYKEYEITPFENQLNLNDGEKIKGIPFLLNSFNHEQIYTDNFLLKIDDNTIINGPISHLNFPTVGTIGEYQIPLQNGKSLYPMNNINCKAYACTANCALAEQSLSRILELSSNGRHRDFDNVKFKMNNKEGVISYTPIKGSATFTIGNFNMSHLVTAKPNCDIDVLDTLSCSGCNKNPVAFLNSYKVKNLGNLQYTSNCTFEEKFVKCSMNKYKMTQLTNHDSCYIYIISLNKTLLLNFDYEFTGQTLNYGVDISYSQNLADISTALFNNVDFVSAFNLTMISMTVLSILAMTLKIIKPMIICCTSWNQKNSVETV